jgi:hypothetical protein
MELVGTKKTLSLLDRIQIKFADPKTRRNYNFLQGVEIIKEPYWCYYLAEKLFTPVVGLNGNGKIERYLLHLNGNGNNKGYGNKNGQRN